MGKAARAIIIEHGKMLVMHRNKEGSEYFTLVGGLAGTDETLEHALVREVKEETGLDVTRARQVFVERHPVPYNEQYIFLCEVAPHDSVAIQDTSEESFMNKISINVHTPLWVDARGFANLHFRTHQLQVAIVEALKNGFPDTPLEVR